MGIIIVIIIGYNPRNPIISQLVLQSFGDPW